MWLPVVSITFWVIAGVAAHCRTGYVLRRREWEAAYLATGLAVVVMAVSMAAKVDRSHPQPVHEHYEPGEILYAVDDIYKHAFETEKRQWLAKQNLKP